MIAITGANIGRTKELPKREMDAYGKQKVLICIAGGFTLCVMNVAMGIDVMTLPIADVIRAALALAPAAMQLLIE